MAKLFWAGAQALFTVSNIQKDYSGVQSVIIDGGISVFSNTTLSNLKTVNDGENGDTLNSTGNAAFVSYLSKASETVTPSIYVNWQSGGKTDSHSVGEITVCNPVVDLNFSESTSYYSDAPKFNVTVNANAKDNKPFYNATTGLIELTSESFRNTVTSALGEIDLKNQITQIIRNHFTTSGEHIVNIKAETTTSDKPTATSLSRSLVSKSANAIKLLNATKAISVNGSTNDTSIYIAAGQSREFAYTVVPHVDGVAYSYALSFVQTASTSVVTLDSVAPSASAEGKFTIVANDNAAGQSTAIQLKSTASATGEVLSPTVTIYITAANTEIFINVGDIYYMSVMDAETIAEKPDSSVATAEIVGENGAKRLKITGANVSGNTQQTSVTLASGTVITINVAHIDVTIA